jgi:TPR repeat protein
MPRIEFKRIDPDEAVEKLIAAANSGNAGAALMLVEIFARGAGVNPSQETASHWMAVALKADRRRVAAWVAERLARMPHDQIPESTLTALCSLAA